MPLTGLVIDPRTVDELSPQVVDELRTQMHPGDCQTCNGPLSGEDPSLVVDSSGTSAQVTLHHPRCQPSAYRDSGPVQYLRDQPTVSYLARFGVVALGRGNTAALTRVVLVHPSLELATLDKQPTGGWAVSTLRCTPWSGWNPSARPASSASCPTATQPSTAETSP